MKLKHEQFVIDENGKRKAIIIPITTYQKMIEVIEDLEDVNYIKRHKNDNEISLEEFMVHLKEEHLV